MEFKKSPIDGDSTTLLQNIFRHKVVKKDIFFLLEGEKSTEVGVILKGLFRSFYID
jgi:hypothetical protein